MVQINFFFNCRLSLLILRKPHNSSFVVYETSIGSEVMISALFCKWQIRNDLFCLANGGEQGQGTSLYSWLCRQKTRYIMKHGNINHIPVYVNIILIGNTQDKKKNPTPRASNLQSSHNGKQIYCETMFDFKANASNVYGQYCASINLSLHTENNAKGILNCFILKIKEKNRPVFFPELFGFRSRFN